MFVGAVPYSNVYYFTLLCCNPDIVWTRLPCHQKWGVNPQLQHFGQLHWITNRNTVLSYLHSSESRSKPGRKFYAPLFHANLRANRGVNFTPHFFTEHMASIDAESWMLLPKGIRFVTWPPEKQSDSIHAFSRKKIRASLSWRWKNNFLQTVLCTARFPPRDTFTFSLTRNRPTLHQIVRYFWSTANLNSMFIVHEFAGSQF